MKRSDKIVAAFGVDAKQAKKLALTMQKAHDGDKVDAALDLANKVLDGHGVEAIRGQWIWSYGDFVEKYDRKYRIY